MHEQDLNPRYHKYLGSGLSASESNALQRDNPSPSAPYRRAERPMAWRQAEAP